MSLWYAHSTGHGIWTQPVNIGQQYVNKDSTVLASICEISIPPGETPQEPNEYPFVGAAGMKINNIAPQDTGVVDLQVEVDRDQDLSFRISLAIWT